MALLDSLLGNSSDQEERTQNTNMSVSEDFQQFESDPSFGFSASDILKSESSESDDGDSENSSFTGVGDISFGFEAPVSFTNYSSDAQSSSSSSASESDGGLLAGLLG